MKKIIAIALSLILAFGLTACGKKAEDDKKGGSSSKVTESTATNTISEVGTTTDTNSSNVSDITSSNVSSIPSTPPEPTTPSTPATPSQPTTSSQPDNSTESPKVEETKNEFYNPNNSNYDVNSISIKPRYVYWENGNLVAECFVVNGFAHNVFNINVKSITFSNSSGTIATGNGFGVLNNLNLPPYTNTVWTFHFGPQDIANYGADLSQLTCTARISNSY